MDRALQRTTARGNGNVDLKTPDSRYAVTVKAPGESAAGHLHVDVFASHQGNGADGFHHMADHVDDGQVDDGPVGSRRWLLRDAASLIATLLQTGGFFISRL